MILADRDHLALKSNQVPFFVRPISSAIANRIIAMMVFPNIKRHLAFLEKQLETSGGDFLTGPDLTAADIIMSYPLLAGQSGFDGMGKFAKGTAKETFPKVYACMFKLSPLSGSNSFARKALCEPRVQDRPQVADTSKTWTD